LEYFNIVKKQEKLNLRTQFYLAKIHSTEVVLYKKCQKCKAS